MTNKIKEFRDRSRLTIDEVAMLTGLDRSTICKHENFARTPSNTNVEKYCKVFKCTALELMGIKLPNEE